jgi:hypothetical protein
MRLEYTVFSVSESPFAVTADVNGTPRDVTVQGIVAEVVSTDGTMSHTFRLIDDLDEARALFVPGNTITLTIEG